MENQIQCFLGVLIKATVASGNSSVWEKASFPAFALMLAIQLLSKCLWYLSSYCPSNGVQKE